MDRYLIDLIRQRAQGNGSGTYGWTDHRYSMSVAFARSHPSTWRPLVFDWFIGIRCQLRQLAIKSQLNIYSSSSGGWRSVWWGVEKKETPSSMTLPPPPPPSTGSWESSRKMMMIDTVCRSIEKPRRHGRRRRRRRRRWWWLLWECACY